MSKQHKGMSPALRTTINIGAAAAFGVVVLTDSAWNNASYIVASFAVMNAFFALVGTFSAAVGGEHE